MAARRAIRPAAGAMRRVDARGRRIMGTSDMTEAVAGEAARPAGGQATLDLEKAPVADVIAKLRSDPDQGLTNAEAKSRLAQYGPNALVEKQQSFAAKMLGHFTGPIAYMIEAAALVSAAIGHWEDFAIISALLFFNVALEIWQDRKASTALEALKRGLAPEAVVKRDGKWGTVEAATLVPGDMVKIRLGVIVPADLRIVRGDYASIDQAGAHGQFAAGLQENRRRGLCRQRGQTGDGGRRHRHRLEYVFGRTAKWSRTRARSATRRRRCSRSATS